MNSHQKSYRKVIQKLFFKIICLFYFISHDMHLNSFMCFLCVSSGCLLEVMNGNVSQLCYNVLFYMSSQRTWARACKITLTAFVIFFSSVRFQMCPQIGCPRKGKVTLVAFVRFFSAVYFQMSPQRASFRGCKVTLVAFVWLFPSVHFQMCPQTAYPRICIITLVAFV